MTVEIANVVGSGDLGVELDVEAVEADLSTPYSEYDPSNYHGLYVRLEEDGPLITIYRSGKYIISGCSSKELLHETNEAFQRLLADLDVIEENAQIGFTIQNVVCTAMLDEPVSLNALTIGLGLEVTEYEPEQFPGLVYRPAEIGAVLLVFANGKMVITGAKNVETAESAYKNLQSKVHALV
ncbi:TATA-box-binding protein [Halorubrum sp. ASP1]|jgi:transcription initiation factor TFIID TATA-box-binding protein|uniref:TATA-box-binding protein n=1 Tax=Halorubrum ezzemoulense TaxID=337243 RepID=A0A238Y7Z7_HALEZ|nr:MULTISPECIES: TATA-box-binding protein [Halorubrum]TKX60531.1 TATA-box-binding protein [Halorubrum sp. ASP1]SNR66724.1 TATA binding protein of transcription factor TFIID [Halorubrum ezzemoulense]